MKTRFRTATIIFAIGQLGLIGAIPGFVLARNIENPGQLSGGVVAMLLIFISLFIGGIVGIIWLTLRVKIDQQAGKISFHYPFRFQTFSYDTKDLLGFRYRVLEGKVPYKSLKFRTKGDKRTFSISDFETANLRELERFALEHFELRAGKEFSKLTDKEKKGEVAASREFDREQMKDIRFYFGSFVLVGAVIVSVLTYRMYTSQVTNTGAALISIVVLLAIEYWTIKRFLQIHENIREDS